MRWGQIFSLMIYNTGTALNTHNSSHIVGFWDEYFTERTQIVPIKTPDKKIYGANMGPTWVLSAPGGPHVGLMNLAIWDIAQCHGMFLSAWHWQWSNIRWIHKTDLNCPHRQATMWLLLKFLKKRLAVINIYIIILLYTIIINIYIGYVHKM